jgi:translation initiation factor 2A
MAALDAGTTTNEAEDGIMLTTKLLMRGKEGVSLLLGPRGDRNLADKEATEGVLKDASVETTMSQICEFSPDGLLLARTVSKGIELVRTEEYGKTPPSVLIDDIPVERVQKLVWSPLGRFLVTWHKPEAGTPAQTGEGGGGGEMTGNLRVFSASTGLRVAAFPMKKLTAMAWPALQWTANEEFACHMVNNEVRVYEGAALDKGWIGKIKVEGLASMSVSPSSSLPVKIAAFCPESKGRPASVKILQFPQLATAIASKTFYQAQEAHMDWSPNGQAVLIKTHTDVDGGWMGVSFFPVTPEVE